MNSVPSRLLDKLSGFYLCFSRNKGSPNCAESNYISHGLWQMDFHNCCLNRQGFAQFSWIDKEFYSFY
jgi:hypothetical protein